MAPEQKNPQQTFEVAKRNWQAEVETAQTYRDLAERERDEKRKGILLRMAEAEERHAQRWEAKLRELGAESPVYNNTLARRLNRWWNRIAGAEIAIRRMEATEEKQEAEFRDQAERTFAGEQEVQEFLRKSALEEKAHARALSAMAQPVSPRTALDKILKRERCRWAQVHTLPLKAKRKCTRPKSRVNALRLRKIPRRKSRRCRFSISYKDSHPRNPKKWRSAWRNNPSNLCRRWRKASSAYPNIAFPTTGARRCRRAFPRPSVRLSR